MTSRLMEEFFHNIYVDRAKEIIADNALPLEKIAEYFDLPLDEVKQLAEQCNSAPSSAQKK